MRCVLGLRVDARHYVHVLRRILRRFFIVVFGDDCDGATFLPTDGGSSGTDPLEAGVRHPLPNPCHRRRKRR